MLFLDKRIRGICDELKKEALRQRMTVEGWQYKEGLFFRPEEAKADPAPFLPFDSKTMYWLGTDRHYWFTNRISVPACFEGKALWLHIGTQIDGWDARNPQFLAFIDGVPVQGLDTNHREILLTACAKAGKEYQVDLQAYTGIEHAELKLVAEYWEIDPDIQGLFYDLDVPLSAFPRMEKDDPSRQKLEKVMNDAINLLDLRTAYSPAYMDSIREARKFLAKALYEDLAGHDEVIATCIGHTHIDVAWWWTVAQTREKAARSFSTVLRLMDEYPNYRFMSSQPQLYAFVKERYPELFEKIRQRVKEGRWEPEGGMWVEADCNLTSGESLVRQFIHGKKFFKDEFGVDNKILWLPDVFGYSGALPQIMKECGIEYFMTTKLAWNQINQHPYDTFMWKGIDGTSILTHLITTLGVGQDEKNFFTTYNGMLHPDALIGGWHRYQQKELNNDILISYGHGDGGGGPTREMLETSTRMEKGVTGLPKVRQEFSRKYFDELNERVKDNPRLPKWEGELYFEYHRGTYTSMARNKRANRKAELGMMDLELLSVLAGEKVAYPADTMDRLWKCILINQFHDILPGSSIHEVYEVTKKEYAEMAETRAQLMGKAMAALCPGDQNVTVFNTKGFASDEVVCLPECRAAALKDGEGNCYPVQQTEKGGVVYLPALPAKGYKVFEEAEAPAPSCPFVQTGHTLETPFYTLELDENGLFARLYDKDNQREVLQEGMKGNLFRMYEDKPIYYDNWDIDIFYTEKFWDVTALDSLAWTEMGPERATLEITRKVSNSLIRQKVHFYAHSRRVDFDTYVDWHEHQHLLKVHFPVDVHTDEATFEIQFGNLKRKTHQNTSWDVARFESCGQKWMDLSEGHYGVSLLNDCKYGHSVRDGVIGLTLIKSGIEPNPVTDQEEHFFTYALYPHEGDWRQGGTVHEAYRLNQPALVTKGGKAGESFSLAQVSAPNVILETVKPAEDGDGTILRLYETDNARTPVTLHWARPITSAEECNCLEEIKQPLTAKDDTLSFVIKPYEIKTIRIR